MSSWWAKFRTWPWWAQAVAWMLFWPAPLGLFAAARPASERPRWLAIAAVGLLVWIGLAAASDTTEGDATEVSSAASTTTEAPPTSTTTTNEREPRGETRSSDSDAAPPEEIPDPTGSSGGDTAGSTGVTSLAAGDALIGQLTVAHEGPRQGYDRDLFSHWSDLDRDGCDTRQAVLIAEAVNGPPQLDPSRCRVIAGSWFSIYDGQSISDPSGLDIDHMVALAEAWDSGAASWSTARREAFANDLGYEHSLVAVSASSNRSKSDRDPSAWRPPRQEGWCWYATAWTQTKVRWGLTADDGEVQALRDMFRTCDAGDAPAPAPAPAVAPPPPPPPPPPTTAAPPPSGGCANGHNYVTADGSCIDHHDDDGNGDVNCSEVDASAKPVQVLGADPYDLDRDSNGVGCQS